MSTSLRLKPASASRLSHTVVSTDVLARSDSDPCSCASYSPRCVEEVFCVVRVVRGRYSFAWSAPANPITAGASTATSEAILPSASTSIADGVPLASKARPVENCWSNTIAELNPISLLASAALDQLRTLRLSPQRSLSLLLSNPPNTCWKAAGPTRTSPLNG
jgi:hypothetical protein